MSETSEKICKSTFQVKISVLNVIFFTLMRGKHFFYIDVRERPEHHSGPENLKKFRQKNS